MWKSHKNVKCLSEFFFFFLLKPNIFRRQFNCLMLVYMSRNVIICEHQIFNQTLYLRPQLSVYEFILSPVTEHFICFNCTLGKVLTKKIWCINTKIRQINFFTFQTYLNFTSQFNNSNSNTVIEYNAYITTKNGSCGGHNSFFPLYLGFVYSQCLMYHI